MKRIVVFSKDEQHKTYRAFINDKELEKVQTLQIITSNNNPEYINIVVKFKNENVKESPRGFSGAGYECQMIQEFSYDTAKEYNQAIEKLHKEGAIEIKADNFNRMVDMEAIWNGAIESDGLIQYLDNLIENFDYEDIDTDADAWTYWNTLVSIRDKLERGQKIEDIKTDIEEDIKTLKSQFDLLGEEEIAAHRTRINARRRALEEIFAKKV